MTVLKEDMWVLQNFGLNSGSIGDRPKYKADAPPKTDLTCHQRNTSELPDIVINPKADKKCKYLNSLL